MMFFWLNLLYFSTIIVDYKSVTDENLGFTSLFNHTYPTKFLLRTGSHDIHFGACQFKSLPIMHPNQVDFNLQNVMDANSPMMCKNGDCSPFGYINLFKSSLYPPFPRKIDISCW